jgi:hypothetical protein
MGPSASIKMFTVLCYHVLPGAEGSDRGYTGRMPECGFDTDQPAWSIKTPPTCGTYVYQCLTVASRC